MAQYTYTAKQGPQKILEGSVDADTLDAAVKKILQSGLTPIDVQRQDKAGGSSKPLWAQQFIWSHKISGSNVTAFLRQLSDLVDADVPAFRALGHIRKQVTHPQMGQMIDQLFASVRDGAMLSEAMAKFPQTFPPVYVNIVRSGEVSGNLNVVLRRLADFSESEQEVRSQIKASLIYPGMILVVGCGTVFVLLTWVVPRLSLIFEDFNESLPLPTKILLALSGFFSHFWWLVLAFLAVAGFFLQRLISNPAGKRWWDHLKLNLPVLGNFYRDVEISRFTRTLGTLLENGVAITASLKSVTLVMENEEFKAVAEHIETEVTAGKSLSQAVKETGFFPETAMQMITVSEETGAPAKGLSKLAGYYERRVGRFMKSMTSMIEPALILVLGLIVGSVVLAMLMPLFRINMLVN